MYKFGHDSSVSLTLNYSMPLYVLNLKYISIF